MSEGPTGGRRTDLFDEREKAFEAKYRHDEETSFRVDARCARLFGLWAAAHIGLSGQAAATYAKTVREADLARPNHQEMLAKVMADLIAKGIRITDVELRGKRESLLEEAKKQIVNELATGQQRLDPSP